MLRKQPLAVKPKQPAANVPSEKGSDLLSVVLRGQGQLPGSGSENSSDI